MAIATSGDRRILNTALDRLGITNCFVGILTCSELKTNKSVPTIYLWAAELLGTAPEETAVFEDVLHGIEAARSVGFITYAIEDNASIQDKIKGNMQYRGTASGRTHRKERGPWPLAL